MNSYITGANHGRRTFRVALYVPTPSPHPTLKKCYNNRLKINCKHTSEGEGGGGANHFNSTYYTTETVIGIVEDDGRVISGGYEL